MADPGRGWMYGGWKKNGAHTREWMNKTKKFMDRAFSIPPNQGVKCPCSRCRNALREDKMLKRLKSVTKKLFGGKSMAYNLFRVVVLPLAAEPR
jgi:hypothetical protein